MKVKEIIKVTQSEDLNSSVIYNIDTEGKIK